MILDKLTSVKKFWREKRITNLVFQFQANSGDLILFKGKSISAKIQRSLTGSEYDHIGIILKYANDDIVILDSCGNRGVGLISWRAFINLKFFKLYHKIVWRKLEAKRNEQFINKLDKFIRFALKKKYCCSLTKLLRKKPKKTDDNLDNSKKTFFCSELVAAAYKYLNLLPSNISAT